MKRFFCDCCEKQFEPSTVKTDIEVDVVRAMASFIVKINLRGIVRSNGVKADICKACLVEFVTVAIQE